MQMTQIGAIMRCEMRMQWRRRGIIVLTFVLLVIVVGLMLLLTSEDFIVIDRMRAMLAPVVDEVQVHTMAAIYVVLIALMAFGVAVPVMTTETLPLDHEYRVTDTLWSLPLARGTYLLGKLLAVWASLLLGLLVCCALSALILWFRLGALDLIGYGLLWLVGVLPMTLFSSALGVLLGSTQSSRRRAVLLVTPLSLYPYAVVVFNMNNIWRALAALHPQSSAPAIVEGGTGTPLEMYSFLALNIAACWLLAWGWQRWREWRE
ncbi:MAG: hypothetical protein U0694_18145 [Anaerolineae bacterium]